MKLHRSLRCLLFSISANLAGMLCIGVAVAAEAKSLVLALPAPAPPTWLYRLDTAPADHIFEVGFESRAPISDETPEGDLLRHLTGVYASTTQKFQSGWVASSGDLAAATNILQVMATHANPAPRIWMYVIQPTSQSYSVRWAVNELLLRQKDLPPEKRMALLLAQDLAHDNDTWVNLGYVANEDVMGAFEWIFDKASTRYIKQIRYHINKNNMRLKTPPDSQQSNPLEYLPHPCSGSKCLVSYQYAPPLSSAAIAAGTVRQPVDWSLSCAGSRPVGAFSDAAAAMCKIDAAVIQEYVPAAVSRPSVLAFATSKGTLCMEPGSERKKAAFPQKVIVARLATCTANSPQFEYDEFKRLYVNWNEARWCLRSVWDDGQGVVKKVGFEPCAINVIEQKWSIRSGLISTYENLNPLQLTNDLKVATVKGEATGLETLRISPADMAPDFFEGPSPSKSNQVEIAMQWSWDNLAYYSRYTAGWSKNYSDRSYYDYNRQTICLTRLSVRQHEADINLSKEYCLKSKQYQNKYWSWDWTDYKVCRECMTEVPMNMRWAPVSWLAAANNGAEVEWRDMDNHPLWVVAKGRWPGSNFTSESINADYYNTSVRKFSIKNDAIYFGDRFAPDYTKHESSVPANGAFGQANH